MALHRKHSFIDTFVSYDPSDDQRSTSEQRWRRAIVSTNPWMNKIKPFFNGNKNEDGPECRNRARYIRDSCKVFADLWKTDKDFLNKSIDSDVSKAFKEFRSSETARGYYSPHGQSGAPSILNSAIDDLINIHEHIDDERRNWLEKIRTISEQAKEKQSTIRQTMSDLRDSYDRAQRKFETADTNFRKFQTRSDRISIPNYDERFRELEDIRTECDQARTLARDMYATETFRISSEEHSIARDFFAQFLFEEQMFYNDIQKYLSKQIPTVQNRLEVDKLAPSFHCDLTEHCLKRIHRPIAYPIEICVSLLKKSVQEEGLFRIAPAHGKQKKLAAELDLQLIEKNAKLTDLGYDAHVAAGTLKQYLRELPDCLLTDELLPQWIEVPSLSTEDARLQRIGDLINQLPKVHYDNLCYLIRFLSCVAEHSSINKMTASNIGICIGCSLLYTKEQLSNPSMPTSYTHSSIIVELMIIHHKKLFPSDNQQENQTSNRAPPDVIPIVPPSNNHPAPSENLINLEIPEPSPRTSRKHPAPRPPVVRQISAQNEPPYSQQNSGEETSTEQFPSEQITVSTSPTLNMIRKGHSRNGSNGIELDRPNGPPPLPPPTRHKISIHKKEHETSPSKEENESPTLNDGVQVGKLNPDLITRMANSNINSGQTNNIRISSRHDNIPSSPGEITQF